MKEHKGYFFDKDNNFELMRIIPDEPCPQRIAWIPPRSLMKGINQDTPETDSVTIKYRVFIPHVINTPASGGNQLILYLEDPYYVY